MKRIFLLAIIFSTLSLTAMAQDDYKKIGEKFAIHDSESKIDFQLMESNSEYYLKVWINTQLNIGCIDTGDYVILYLDNGNDVDLVPMEKNCGKLSSNKKHRDYEIIYKLLDEHMDEMTTHKVEYLEIEAEHQTLERKAENFQDISREHFENYFKKNLPISEEMDSAEMEEEKE